jgi:hypothetical protein
MQGTSVNWSQSCGSNDKTRAPLRGNVSSVIRFNPPPTLELQTDALLRSAASETTFPSAATTSAGATEL